MHSVGILPSIIGFTLKECSFSFLFLKMLQMISLQSLDIVGFQEVRLEAGHGTNNQIGQLAEFFPDYQVIYDTSISLGCKE